jgi:TPR repeat protein
MRNLIKAGVVALVLCLAAPVTAGPFEDGADAAKRGDYATALRLWHPLADQGGAEAQYNLGVLYTNGLGVPQDYAEAAKWFRKAADQGDAGAQSNLGFMYAKGQGVPEDYVRAHMWFSL